VECSLLQRGNCKPLRDADKTEEAGPPNLWVVDQSRLPKRLLWCMSRCSLASLGWLNNASLNWVRMILNEDYRRIFGVLLLAFSAALMVEAPLLVFQYGSNEIA